MDEKLEKIIEVSNRYNKQIHELEFLLESSDKSNNENDKQHAEDIKTSIELTKEEMNQELDILKFHYKNVLNELNESFKTEIFVRNHEIQTMNERFKLDIINLINAVVNPHKGK